MKSTLSMYIYMHTCTATPSLHRCYLARASRSLMHTSLVSSFYPGHCLEVLLESAQELFFLELDSVPQAGRRSFAVLLIIEGASLLLRQTDRYTQDSSLTLLVIPVTSASVSQLKLQSGRHRVTNDIHIYNNTFNNSNALFSAPISRLFRH